MLEDYASNLSTSIDTSLQPLTSSLASTYGCEGNYYNVLTTNRSSFNSASYDLPVSFESDAIAQSAHFNSDISVGNSVIPSQSIYDYYNSNFSQNDSLFSNQVDSIAQPSSIMDDRGISSDKSLIARSNIFDYSNYNFSDNSPSSALSDLPISTDAQLVSSIDSLSVLSNAQTDIVWRNSSTGANLVWQMNGTNLSSTVGLASVGDSNWKIGATGDFNSDGQTDIVWRNSTTGGNLIWLMNGNTLSSTVGLASVGDSNWKIEGAADFNSDAKTDIIWRNYSTGANLVWLMNGTSLSSSVGLASVGDTNWRIEAAADFNSDAKNDIVWRNSSTGANLIWLMNGTSLSSTVGLASVGDTNWKIEAASDFNSDAKTDLVWRNYSTGANLIWLMNGTSLSSTVGLASVGDSNWQVAGVIQRQTQILDPVYVPFSPTGNVDIDGLLKSDPYQYYLDTSKNGGVITYSFYRNTSGPYYGTETVSEVNDTIKNSVRDVFANLSRFIPIKFVEVADTTTNYGVIRYMFSNGNNTSGFYAYSLSSNGDNDPYNGDIHLNPNAESRSDAFSGGYGSYGYGTLIHETLHSLGLKHPGNYNGTSGIGSGPFLSPEKDNNTNTIMTYNGGGAEPITPMSYDIRALQYLYGAASNNSTATTYKFISGDSYYIDNKFFGSTTADIKQTIWDSGGVDTLDMSALPSDSYVFDMTEGGIITTYTYYNSEPYTDQTTEDLFYTSYSGVTIAYNTIIENLINSQGDDYINANSAANTFKGYSLGTYTGDDYYFETTNTDVIELSGYSLSNLRTGVSSGTLTVNLGNYGSIKVEDYFASSSSMRFKIGSNYYRYSAAGTWQLASTV